MLRFRSFWLTFIASLILVPLILGCKEQEVVIQKEMPIGYDDNFYGVSFVDSQKGWAVGYYGLIAHTEDGGKTWVRQNCGTREPLFSVDFVDENNGWIVGKFAQIYHTADGGKTFSSQESPVEEDLFAVSFVDAQNGWVVGTFGTILHTSDGGKTWEQQGEVGVDTIYNTVFFVDKENGWAGGEYATILRTRDGGLHWEKTTVPLDTGYSVFDIRFANPDTGVAVGMDGAILLTQDGGNTWEAADSPSESHLFGVAIADGNAWACGLRGSYVFTDKGDLRQWVLPSQEFKIKYWMSDVCFVDANHGWMVGSHGILRRTRDGGKTWEGTE